MADVRHDRGVSTVLGYTLNVAVALLLVGGLVTGVAGVVDRQREHVVREELGVVGQRLVADLATADRLARTADGGRVRLATPLPRRVAGQPYRIRLRDTATGGTVVLTTDQPSVSVSVEFRAQTVVTDSTQRGGAVAIRYDGSTIRLGDGS
jgi:hypothetical protein